MSRCDRCDGDKSGDGHFLEFCSWYNGQLICRKCCEAERNRADYDDCRKAEAAAVRAGDRNFVYLAAWKETYTLPQPEYGVADIDYPVISKDAKAVYSLRGIHFDHGYTTVPDRVDFVYEDQETKEEFTSTLNSLILECFNFKYRDVSQRGKLDRMSDLVKVLDWGCYKGYARRRTGYVLVSLAYTTDPLDMEAVAQDLRSTQLLKRAEKVLRANSGCSFGISI